MEHLLSELPSKQLRVADLPTRKVTTFDLSPSATEREALARVLGVPSIKKLKFAGTIAAVGGKDWRLEADLGATVVQECVVTLDPVTTRIDEDIIRTYVAELPDIAGSEVEMPEDDSVDEIPETIDLGVVLREALELALPAFPRSEDATLGEAVFTEAGSTPMTDEDAKPFAGLGALRDALENKGNDDT